MHKKSLLVVLGMLLCSAPLLASEAVDGRKEEVKVGFIAKTKAITRTPFNFAKSSVKAVYKVGNVLVYIIGIGTVSYVAYCVYNREELDVSGLTESEFAKYLLNQSDSNGIIWSMRLPGLGRIVVIPSWLASIINSGELILQEGRQAVLIASEKTIKSSEEAAKLATQKAQAAIALAQQAGGQLKDMGTGLGRLLEGSRVATRNGLNKVAQAASKIGQDIQDKASELVK